MAIFNLGNAKFGVKGLDSVLVLQGTCNNG
jgi:hypothetical protein